MGLVGLIQARARNRIVAESLANVRNIIGKFPNARKVVLSFVVVILPGYVAIKDLTAEFVKLPQHFLVGTTVVVVLAGGNIPR